MKEALGRWERRIEIDTVDAHTEGDGAIRVLVKYKILATNSVQTLNWTARSR